MSNFTDSQEMVSSFLRHCISGNVGDFAATLESKFGHVATFERTSKDFLPLQRHYLQLRNCANAMLQINLESERLIKDAEQTTKRMLASDQSAFVWTNSKRLATHSDFDLTTIFRQWFSDNIAFPFPSTDIKHELVQLTNSNLRQSTIHDGSHATSYETCQLWFINSRRRSLWTLFYRGFADSQPGRMLKLCGLLRSQVSHTRDSIELRIGQLLNTWRGMGTDELAIVAKKCVDHFNHVVDWIEQKPTEESGTWLDGAISEGMREYKSARTVAKAYCRRFRAEVQDVAEQNIYLAEAKCQSNVNKRKSACENYDGCEGRHCKAYKVASLGAKDTSDQPEEVQPFASRSNATFSSSSASSHSSAPSLVEAGDSSYDSCESLGDTRIRAV